MTRLRLAIISTHPIQYYSPVFRDLAASERLNVRVFYTWSQAKRGAQFDAGFGTAVQWDVPLLDGYDYRFVANVAKRPGPQHFLGLITPTLIREISAWHPDAVLVYTWNSHAHLQALRYFKGRLPVFFRGDSTLLDRRSWLRTRLRRTALRWIYRHIDVAIAVGSNNRDYFVWCGVPPGRIAIAPHSVDTVRFSADTAAHDRRAAGWRRDLGIAAGAIVVLFAGKLQAKKDPGLLLRAFSHLTNGSHLVFVGNGHLEAALRQQAGALRNVHFMPFQNQSVMPAVYRLGDVFVLPSCGPEETWGLAVNEALACGRPVIASSRVGAARDLIVPGGNGWTFEASEHDELVQVLKRATTMGKGVLHAMGERGRQGVRSVVYGRKAPA